MTQQEFRIDVGQGRISYSYGYAGDEQGEERKDIDLPIDNLTLQTAKLLEGWLNVWDWIGLTNDRVRKILLTSATFRVVGKHLWMLILDNEVGAKLLEKIPTSPDSPLRVVINFDQASSDIRGLPWEFLCTPDPEIFLAAATNLLLTRLAPQSAFPRNQVEYATNRLGVLFVTALPGLKMYDRVNDRVRSFQNELMKQPGLDVLELIDELEVDRIEAALSDDEHPCHVVHITGLCRGDPGQPQLWMEGSTKGPPGGIRGPWSEGARRGVLVALATSFPQPSIGRQEEWQKTFPEHQSHAGRDLALVPTVFDKLDAGLCRALVHRGWWLVGAALATYHPGQLPADLTELTPPPVD